MDTSVLEDLGLSSAEAKIYLALLKKGQSKTGAIIDATKMQSSTVYHALGSLVEKGLASYIFKGKIKHYRAEKPESFLLFLEEKKRRFNEILPELKEREKISRQKQSAKVYEGFKGLKAAFNDVLSSLKPGEEYYFFQIPKEQFFSEKNFRFLRNYHLKRGDKGIKVKGLAIKELRPIMKDMFKNIKHTKLRYINETLPTALLIYKNKLMTVDWEEAPTAFVIESDNVANSYKKFFEEKWLHAKA